MDWLNLGFSYTCPEEELADIEEGSDEIVANKKDFFHATWFKPTYFHLVIWEYDNPEIDCRRHHASWNELNSLGTCGRDQQVCGLSWSVHLPLWMLLGVHDHWFAMYIPNRWIFFCTWSQLIEFRPRSLICSSHVVNRFIFFHDSYSFHGPVWWVFRKWQCRRSTRSVWRWKRPLRSICHKQCVVRPANGSGRSGANTRPKREDRATGSAQGGKWENSVSWVQHVNFNVELMSVLVHSKSILVYGQKLNCLSASRQVRRFHPEQSFQAQQLAIGTAGTAGSLHGRNGWAIDGNHCRQSAAERSCSSAWKIVLIFLETSGGLVLSDSTS